ncbi:MAG: hypothetical protein JW850_00385 [Thermoflexales bacterium]|nr:hypothetical protein [Thermoflexales bacterium]
MKLHSCRITLFTLVLLLAACARLAGLDRLPPGWRDDELIEVEMDSRIAAGWHPLYIEEAEGHEPLYHYVHAATIALFGPSRLSYRWLGAACGLLAVAMTMALGRRWLAAPQPSLPLGLGKGDWAALLAGTAMATGLWPLMYSRLGLRHVGILPPLLLVMLCLRYLSSPRSAPGSSGSPFHVSRFTFHVSHFTFHALLAGCFLAAGLYTYFAGRVVPLIVLAYAAYLALFHRAAFKRQWLGLAVMGSVAALVFAPLGLHLAARPLETRLEVVGRPLIELSRGNPKPALETTLGTLGMFTLSGDPEWLYNFSTRPVFDWVTGLCFYLGLGLALWRWRRVEYGLLLIWLLGGLSPAMLSLPAASFSHTIAAQPAVYLVLGLGLAEVLAACSLAPPRVTKRRRPISPPSSLLPTPYPLLLVLSVLALHGALSLYDYAVTWGRHPATRFMYHADVADLARYLNAHPNVQDVAVSTTAEELALEARGLELDLTRSSARPRLFDPRHALALPLGSVPDGEPTHVALISDPPPAPHVQALLLAQDAPLDTGPDTARGPAFRLYAVSPLEPAEQPALSLPLTFGQAGQLSLVEMQVTNLAGQDMSGSQDPSSLQLRTVWQVEKDTGMSGELKLFVHLLGADGQLLTTGDRLDVWPPVLRTGDQFVQWNELPLPAGATPGRYYVTVGLYEPDGPRWPVKATGQDHVGLEITLP